MIDPSPPPAAVPLLRPARAAYGFAMRRALEDAGYGDIPSNGLYVIGGLALGAGDIPHAALIRDLRISKQAAARERVAEVAETYRRRVPMLVPFGPR